jgi:hypothetical protein
MATTSTFCSDSREAHGRATILFLLHLPFPLRANYREFMDAVHALKHMAHQAKELFEEIVDEANGPNQLPSGRICGT